MPGKVFRSLSRVALLLLATCALTFAQDASTPTQPSPQPGNDAGAGNAGAAVVTSPASATDTGAKPMRVGGDVKPPKVLYDPDPSYTEAARHAGYQGTVICGWLSSRMALPTG